MSDLEETGSIDWLLLEARGKEINGELVPPLLDLVDRQLIRILDVLILVKRTDDDFDALTTSELDPERVGDLGALDGASSGLLSDEDAATAAAGARAGQHRSTDRVRESVVASVRSGRPQSRGPAHRPGSHSDPGDPGGAGLGRELTRGELVMGLIGGMARTAVVAGTATAVSNRVSRRQANRWAGQSQSAYAEPQYAQPQYAEPQYAQPQYRAAGTRSGSRSGTGSDHAAEGTRRAQGPGHPHRRGVRGAEGQDPRVVGLEHEPIPRPGRRNME